MFGELGHFWLPLDTRHRVLVSFFPTLKALRVAEKSESRFSRANSWACFVEYYGASEIAGRLLFCPKQFGAGIVAHELQHIIMAWVQRKGWGGNDSPDEEKVAEFAEHITRGFWNRYYRLFPQEKPKGAECTKS